jgi:hypothetical protein
MDATSFFSESAADSPPCPGAEWFAAAGRVAFGAALLFGVARWVPPQDAYVAGWIGMIGLVSMLHFGVFHLLSCAWRSVNVQARPLMNRPLASTSVSEFWGRRWNTAFRDLTHRWLFRPLAARVGSRAAVLAGFLISGLVHDLVISVPAGGGYGGPTLYFGIQGAAVTIERSAFGRTTGLGSGMRGRLFAIVVVLAPVGFLFHRPFVVGIIVPFMQALGALQWTSP